jgi:DNA-binding LacI/PurR family transcriptional regulator
VSPTSGRSCAASATGSATPPSDRDRAHLAGYLTEQHVDGVLLLSLHGHDELAEGLDARGVPTVFGGRPVDSSPAVVVDADNLAGGRAAVEHLLGLGRRRLVVLTGPQDMSSGRDRLAGAREAWGAAGHDTEGLVVAFGDYSEASGGRAMREVLATGVVPDAVFAASDLMAVGALRVLREAGMRVPDDVALVGFDDSPVCRHTDPQLTSVHQPVEEMGRVMADLLLARIAGQAVPAETVLPTRLVVRDSA